MTSLTTIFGLLPLAFALGEGAELRAPMARTVMGGTAGYDGDDLLAEEPYAG